MEELLTIISLATFFTSCDSTTKKTSNMEDPNNQTDNSTSPADTTPKVTGIAGQNFSAELIYELHLQV